MSAHQRSSGQDAMGSMPQLLRQEVTVAEPLWSAHVWCSMGIDGVFMQLTRRMQLITTWRQRPLAATGMEQSRTT